MFTPWVSWSMVKNHFANSENWTDNQVAVFDALYNVNVPLLGAPWKGAADYYYGSRQADEYRDRHGIDGGGHDPRKLASMGGSPVGMFSGGLNYVSRNLDMLYKTESKKRPLTYKERYEIWLQEKWYR